MTRRMTLLLPPLLQDHLLVVDLALRPQLRIVLVVEEDGLEDVVGDVGGVDVRGVALGVLGVRVGIFGGKGLRMLLRGGRGGCAGA